MASLITGYEYDIFISYRQKDNKGDRWVSEFVEALKNELESTFKEEISVYFDFNPHDGLLETHDVEASLKDKLKCLIFIPIISRTYCDPKSFAWEHEYKAFVKQASQDQFGLRIKLPNGNVASRILPIQIHEITAEDKTYFENELGGVLRAIQFIYKEPGVNKPLIATDDEKLNLNRTKYRIQINKVANAIEEAIHSLKGAQTISIRRKTLDERLVNLVKAEAKESSQNSIISQKLKKILITFILLLLSAFLTLAVLKVIEKNKTNDDITKLEKSIAVLPFHNYSGDPAQEYISDGLTDEIISHLYKVKSFDKVVSLGSAITYKGTDKRLPIIANELNVNYILEGSYKKSGDHVRITAQLVNATKDKQIWENQYYRPYQAIIEIQADIAMQIADHLKAFLTDYEKQNIQKIPTRNQEAYELLQQAISLEYAPTSFTYNKTDVLDLIQRAIKLDPQYADAFAAAGMNILSNSNYGGGKDMLSGGWDALHYFEKAMEIDPENGNAHAGLAVLNDWFTWDYVKAEKEFQQAIKLLPNNSGILSQYGEFRMKMNCKDDTIPYFKESSFQNQFREIRHKIIAGKPKEATREIHEFLNSWQKSGYIWAAELYIWLEKYDSALFYLEGATPASIPEISIPRFQACLALAYQKTNHNSKARLIIRNLIARCDTTSAMSPDFFTAWYYSGTGNMDSAFLWLNKAVKNRSPELPWLKTDPVLMNLRKDKRYWDLYERTGHKAFDDYLTALKH